MKKILVRAPNWIGDHVMAYPFFHGLRSAYPKARITVACLPWVESIQYRNLVDDVVVLRKARAGTGLMSKFSSLEEAARALKAKGPWDMSIALPTSFSSAWIFYRAGARRRRGYVGDGRGFLLNDKLSAERVEELHRAEAYARLLPEEASLGRDATDFWGSTPERPEEDPESGPKAESPAEQALLEALRRDEQEEKGRLQPIVEKFDAKRAWPDADPVDPPAEPYFVLAPGSAAESRRWSALSFIQLAQRIVSQTGWSGVVVGGPAEAPLAKEICESVPGNLVDLTAMGAVSAYWRVFAGSKLTVANDSGLAHVASLCGSPVQVVWGAGNPKQTRPVGPGKAKLIFNPVDCWPCVRNTCSLPATRKLECLRGIEAETVWKEIARDLRL